MSLILEALRKSEAERRRGHMPDLRAELPPAPARATARTPWPWRFALPAAALLALAGWLAASAWRPGAEPGVATSAPAETTTPALPPVPHLQAMVEAQRPPVRERADGHGDDGRRVQAAARDDIVPAPVAAARPTPGTPAATIVDARDASATLHTAGDGAPARAAAQPAPTTAVLPPPASASESAPLQLADLAPEARKALPPLRLSMHLWNDDPSRRFVILDGERLGEGDRIGGLVVTAIVRDGVLLDWNGRAIKVPLR